MDDRYYPNSNDGRADFWENIIRQNALLLDLGFTDGEVTSIVVDARWAVYLYRTVRTTYEDVQKAVINWCNLYLDGPNGGAAPSLPVIPAWPALPADGNLTGIEARRELWVQRAKGSPNYNPPIGIQLGLEASGSPFDLATYQAILNNLTSPASRTVSGKFRKAGGKIDGINLYGRKEGTITWILLGRFNASPFRALVPLAGDAPEPWEFLARAVKRDVEIGLPSAVGQVIIRG